MLYLTIPSSSSKPWFHVKTHRETLRITLNHQAPILTNVQSNIYRISPSFLLSPLHLIGVTAPHCTVNGPQLSKWDLHNLGSTWAGQWMCLALLAVLTFVALAGPTRLWTFQVAHVDLSLFQYWTLQDCIIRVLRASSCSSCLRSRLHLGAKNEWWSIWYGMIRPWQE